MDQMASQLMLDFLFGFLAFLFCQRLSAGVSSYRIFFRVSFSFICVVVVFFRFSFLFFFAYFVFFFEQPPALVGPLHIPEHHQQGMS